MKQMLRFIFLITLNIFFISVGRPLKILFVLDEFPKFNQPFVLEQITGLIKRNHDVSILAGKGRYPELTPPEIEKFDLMSRTSYRDLKKNDQKRFDIICANFGQNACWAAELILEKKIFGQLVTIFHGADITKLTVKHPDKNSIVIAGYKIKAFSSKMYNKVFRVGSIFLGVSNYFKERLIKLGAHPSKAGVHHVGIDCSLFDVKKYEPQSRKKITLVSCSRLVEKKGIDDAISALSIVLKKNSNIIFKIIGDGPCRKKLEKQVKSLGLEKNIEFLGWTPHKEVAKILKDSDIFILPSKIAKSKESRGDQEGIPTVLMEAMAMGIPVLSTYHSGIPELVEHNKSGYLVKEGDVKALAFYLQKLIDTPSDWKRFGLFGRRKVEKEFNTERQNDKLEKLFYDLAQKK